MRTCTCRSEGPGICMQQWERETRRRSFTWWKSVFLLVFWTTGCFPWRPPRSGSMKTWRVGEAPGLWWQIKHWCLFPGDGQPWREPGFGPVFPRWAGRKACRGVCGLWRCASPMTRPCSWQRAGGRSRSSGPDGARRGGGSRPPGPWERHLARGPQVRSPGRRRRFAWARRACGHRNEVGWSAMGSPSWTGAGRLQNRGWFLVGGISRPPAFLGSPSRVPLPGDRASPLRGRSP